MLRILWRYIGEENRGDDSYITCWSLHWKNNTVLPETENMAASHIPKNRVFNSFYVCSQDDMPQYRQYMRNKIAEYCSITSGWWWKLIVPVKAHPASGDQGAFKSRTIWWNSEGGTVETTSHICFYFLFYDVTFDTANSSSTYFNNV